MTDQTSSAEHKAQTTPAMATRRLQGEAIGRALRAQYDAVLAEPVPADLLDLLDALDKRDSDT